MNHMASGTFRLKGRALLKEHNVTMYRVAKDGKVNYPTIHRYITSPDSVKLISLEVLYGLLSGLGLSDEQVANLRLGDVLEIRPIAERTEVE